MANDFDYVKNDDVNGVYFKPGLHQAFEHPPRRVAARPEYVVIREYMTDSLIDRDVGLEILKFLRKFGFGTEQLIQTHIEMCGLYEAVVPDILKRYCAKHVLNRFCVGDYDLGGIPEDALVFYCLDGSGIRILEHFSAEDTITWASTDCIRGSELISRYLVTAQFSVALQRKHPDSIRSFLPLFNVTMNRRIYRFSAAVTLMNGFTPMDYIVETVRDFDIPEGWINTCGDKIGPYSNLKAWKLNFVTEPNYLLLCDDDIIGQEAAEILARNAPSADVIVVTREFMNGDGSAVFSYDRETNSLKENASAI